MFYGPAFDGYGRKSLSWCFACICFFVIIAGTAWRGWDHNRCDPFLVWRGSWQGCDGAGGRAGRFAFDNTRTCFEGQVDRDKDSPMWPSSRTDRSRLIAPTGQAQRLGVAFSCPGYSVHDSLSATGAAFQQCCCGYDRWARMVAGFPCSFLALMVPRHPGP